MRRYRSLVLLLAPALLLAPPATVGAQTIPSPYDFIDTDWDAGFYVAQVSEQRGEAGFGPGGGLMLGLRGGVHLSGPFGMEANAFLLPTDRDIYRPVPELGQVERLGTANTLVGGLDARVRFTLTGTRTWRDLAPYVSAGGGVIGEMRPRNDIEDENTLPQDSRFRMGPSFLGVLGAGTRWFPTEQISIHLETSAHFWKLGTPRNFQQLGTSAGIPDQEWPAIAVLLIGGSYRF
ncbi:MAG: hypothetical protein WD960_05485 [Gemmatimonadota bacterium]